MSNHLNLAQKALLGVALSMSFGINQAHADAVTKKSLIDWVVNASGHNVEYTTAVKIVSNVIGQAMQQKVDPVLLLSLIKNESGFKTSAASNYGARGLMQVVPRWHREKIAGRSINNIATNIEVGTMVLSDCIDKYSSAIKRALQCYSGNASNYTSKIRETYFEIKKYDTLYRFRNELPHTVNSSFHKPRGFKTESLDVLIATL